MADRVEGKGAAGVLARMCVHSGSRVYLIGCLEKRVSFVAQQHRVLNLVWALCREGIVKTGDNVDDQVAIVGGGVAGMTAAVACRAKGVRFQLFEATSALGGIHGPALNRTRYVHPFVSRWPDSQAYTDTADIPYLDWTGGFAEDVIKQIQKKFDKIFPPWHQNRYKARRVRRIEWQGSTPAVLVDHGPTPTRAAVRGPDFSSAAGRQVYAAVIVAVGFGDERRDVRKYSPRYDSKMQHVGYWANDDWLLERKGRWLVIGDGDGALTDALRLAIADFDHAKFVAAVLSLTAGNDRLAQGLAKIEGAAQDEYVRRRADGDKNPDVSELLFGGYRELVGDAMSLIGWLGTRSRGADVTLTGSRRHPFDLKAMQLHRFAAFLLLRGVPGKNPPQLRHEPSPNGDEYDHMLPRIGPEPADKWLGPLFDPPVGFPEYEWDPRGDRTSRREWPTSPEPFFDATQTVASIDETEDLSTTVTWGIMRTRRDTIEAEGSFLLDLPREVPDVSPRTMDMLERRFGFLRDSWFTTGNISPGGDLYSLRDIMQWVRRRFWPERPAPSPQKLGSTADVDENLCCIAGPKDHTLSRYALGYTSGTAEPTEWSPKYVFELRRRYGKETRQLRSVAGGEFPVTEWPLHDRVLDRPYSDWKQMPGDSEPLIVSIVPNTCTRRAFNSGKKILIVAARNFPGQFAMPELFESQEFQALDEELGASQFFWAVFEVETLDQRPTGAFRRVAADKYRVQFGDRVDLVRWTTE